MEGYGRWSLCVAFVTLTSAAGAAEGPDVSSHPMIGEAAPAFDLEEVSGGKPSLDSLGGRYVVLRFGAGW